MNTLFKFTTRSSSRLLFPRMSLLSLKVNTFSSSSPLKDKESTEEKIFIDKHESKRIMIIYYRVINEKVIGKIRC